MTTLERQHRRRARLRAAGLTSHGKVPARRRVVSWVSGRHMPVARPDGRCAECLQRLRPYGQGSGWRHA